QTSSFSLAHRISCCFFLSSNVPPTPAIYTLSLHDALPISYVDRQAVADEVAFSRRLCARHNWPLIDVTRRSAASYGERTGGVKRDRKSTRLNSSHGSISYAVFCLKKKKK